MPLKKEQIKYKKDKGVHYFTLQLPERTKTIRVYSGYFCQLIRLKKSGNAQISSFSQIDAKKITEHLNKIIEKYDQGKALTILSKICSRERVSLKKLKIEEKEIIVNFISKWEFDERRDQRRFKRVKRKLMKILSKY